MSPDLGGVLCRRYTPGWPRRRVEADLGRGSGIAPRLVLQLHLITHTTFARCGHLYLCTSTGVAKSAARPPDLAIRREQDRSV